MNEPQTGAPGAGEDALFAFGDRQDAQPTNELEATMRRVQRASGSDPARSSSIPNDLKHQIWENMMSANAPTMDSTYEPPAISREDTRSSPIRSPLRNHPWNQAANFLLAAALILAVSAGIWRATGGVNFGFGGGPPDQPTVPFGGFVNQDATPDVSAVDPTTLPKAEDCTVQPLTVDEVIWYTQNPDEATRSLDMDNPMPPTPDWIPATPPATDAFEYYRGPADAEAIAAVDAQQRMWMACVLADSWFQIWALEQPSAVSEQVSRAVPRLAGVDEARAILEDLEANGPATDSVGPNVFYAPSAIGYAGLQLDAITVIDTDPEHVFMEGNMQDGKPSGPGDLYIITGYNAYGDDGTLLQSRTVEGTDPGDVNQCKSFMFIWNEARSTWLVFPPLFCA